MHTYRHYAFVKGQSHHMDALLPGEIAEQWYDDASITRVFFDAVRNPSKRKKKKKHDRGPKRTALTLPRII